MQLQYLLASLANTVIIWVGSVAMAAVLSIPVAAGRRSNSFVLRTVTRIWVGVVRGLPPLVWMILLFFGIGYGMLGTSPMFAAVVALGLINSAYFGDSIYAGLNSVPTGQWEAVKSLALPTRLAYTKVILPQAFPIIIASSTAYSIALVKNTALASIIGANEMMFYGHNTVQAGANTLRVFFIIGLIYLALTIPIGMLSRWIESRSVIAAVR